MSLRPITLLQATWLLTELNGKPVAPVATGREQPRLEINLTEGRVTGTTGCNRLNGRVRADTRLIQFGSLAVTRMACLDNAGTTESEFLKALESPLAYQMGDGKLTLTQTNKSVLVFKKVD